MSATVHHADMRAWLAAYDGPLFDAVVCDPPYHLTSIVKRFGKPGSAECKVGATGAYARASRGFMGKEWDGGDVAFRPETWAAVFERMKPGAHLVAFSGTRTYHRMACAIEDAGFEIRDMLLWHYGSGFPKSHDVSKGIDRAAGAVREVVGTSLNKSGISKKNGSGGNGAVWDRVAVHTPITAPATADAEQWNGWGTALKPATEPICLARKPLSEKSVAANLLRWGTGAINVDACRVEGEAWKAHIATGLAAEKFFTRGEAKELLKAPHSLGRWPPNICHDGSAEVLAGFPETDGLVGMAQVSGKLEFTVGGHTTKQSFSRGTKDSGSAARFFYSAKAGPLDRIGTSHATVKPVDLMRWLCRMVTPPGGHILEPFAGSGTTGIAAMAEGFDCTMIEMEAEHVADIERKLAYLRGDGRHSFAEHDRKRDEPQEHAGPLFGEAAA